MPKIEFKNPANIPEEDKKKIIKLFEESQGYTGRIREPQSGCLSVIILFVIISSLITIL